MTIIKKTKSEIELMRKAGRIVRKTLDTCAAACVPGATTGQIDHLAYETFTGLGAKGLFKGYPGKNVPPFPGNICISVNEEVVHGIGSSRKIKPGDVVGLDCGVMLNGWCGDAATTVLVGEVPEKTAKMCQVTREVLDIAVKSVAPGRKWSGIARLMEEHAKKHHFGVVREFVGHGIGQSMHEEPQVPNFVSRELIRNDILLEEGMVLAIEPMCCVGSSGEVMTLSDGWTVITRDKSASAHYEHTVAVTATGADVLTDGR
jgi:methionyl aminopeptidase